MSTSGFTTPIVHTDRWINVRPRAAPHHPPEPSSDRCDATGSVVSSTSTCRSHDVTDFSAPTRRPDQLPGDNVVATHGRSMSHPYFTTRLASCGAERLCHPNAMMRHRNSTQGALDNAD